MTLSIVLKVVKYMTSEMFTAIIISPDDSTLGALCGILCHNFAEFSQRKFIFGTSYLTMRLNADVTDDGAVLTSTDLVSCLTGIFSAEELSDLRDYALKIIEYVCIPFRQRHTNTLSLPFRQLMSKAAPLFAGELTRLGIISDVANLAKVCVNVSVLM